MMESTEENCPKLATVLIHIKTSHETDQTKCFFCFVLFLFFGFFVVVVVVVVVVFCFVLLLFFFISNHLR